MKTLIALGVIIIALGFGISRCNAADPGAIIELKPETKLSVEALGAIRHVNISDGERYGVGVDVGLKFNSWVTGHARLIGYEEPNQWKGPAIDEGSLLVEAQLFASANGRLTLSGVAGGDYDTASRDFGISLGPRLALVLHKNISLVLETRLRAWFNDTAKDLASVGGLRISF